MKVRAVILAVVLCAVVLAGLFEYSWAAGKAESGGAKIGIVSVRRILEGSKRNAKRMTEAAAEHNKVIEDLTKLSTEIESDDKALRTLRPGSSDYLKLLKKVLENKASLQTQDEYHKQEIEAEDRQWHEGLYREIIRLAGEVAKEKGLDVVFENSEPEFPTLSSKELAMTIRMHKLLYSGGCMDITDEVKARLDAGE